MLVFVFTLFLGALAAPAQTGPIKENSFNIGMESEGIFYREPSLGVKEDGATLGVYGDYKYRPQQLENSIINVFDLNGHVEYADMQYKGSGKIKNVPDVLGEPRFWIGKDLNLTESSTLTPYLGIGYRALFDHLDGKTSSTGAQGYDRLSQYLYAPVGFEISTQAVAGWELGFSSEYDIFIRGWQKSYLSTFTGLPDVTNTQKRGYGVRGSINIIKKMDRFNIVISPYIRYWNVKQSDTVTATGSLFQVTGYEPANHSTEYGLQAGIQF